MATTVVTGGAGFIGSHLVEFLLARGDHVLVIDDLSTGTLDNLRSLEGNPKLEVIVDTILNKLALAGLVRRADRVFHLAATVGVRLVATDPIRVVKTNVDGTMAVLATCSESQLPVFLASSSEVYGKSDRLPFREDDDVLIGPSSRSRWSYGATKMLGEFLGQAYHREHGVPVATARFFNISGARQTGQYGMVVPRFVDQALNREPITVYGDGRQTRCFCHVADIVGAIVQMLEVEDCYGEIVNLGQDRPTEIYELAERVKALADSPSPIQAIPFAEAYTADFDDMRDRLPDLTRARKLIGFEPTRGLDDIISDVIDYRQGRRIKAD